MCCQCIALGFVAKLAENIEWLVKQYDLRHQIVPVTSDGCYRKADFTIDNTDLAFTKCRLGSSPTTCVSGDKRRGLETGQNLPDLQVT